MLMIGRPASVDPEQPVARSNFFLDPGSTT